MARFKKGTNDHDGDSRKGGSRRKRPHRPPAEPLALKIFELGRKARRGGIRREDAPYTGEHGTVWRDGWDYQDKA